jgi:flagellar biosynthesis anti-sigma factor FlgM
MKIENPGINGMTTPNRAEANHRVEKKTAAGETVSAASHEQDKAVLSEKARLLAKARASMEHLEETPSEKVSRLKQDVETGNYTIQADEIARRLMAGVFKKE